MTPRYYQEAGALWLAESPRAMLADPPGLGKTPQAILAARMIGAQVIYIICPAVAVSNWRREFRDWWPEARPEIYSYDKVVADDKLRLKMALGSDLLILDEAHYLKSRDAKRTRAIYRPQKPGWSIAARAKYCWALSGTFAPNNVSEYWTHLYCLFPELITPAGETAPLRLNDFIKRFTHWTQGIYGLKIHATKNRPELSAILKQAGLRREIEDVLPDLPPLIWGQESIDPGSAIHAIRAAESTPEVDALRDHISLNPDFHADTVHLSTLRRLIGIAKAGGVGGLVAGELEEGRYRKVVIWCQHREVMDRIEGLLMRYGVARIDGSTPPAQRTLAIQRFQAEGPPCVFLGQIQAAGTAITLTAADQVLFAENSWVPAETLQAAKRCHRFGQTRPVWARIASLEGSIDQLIGAVQTRKLSAHVEIGD